MINDWICSQCGLMHSEHDRDPRVPLPTLEERCADCGKVKDGVNHNDDF